MKNKLLVLLLCAAPLCAAPPSALQIQLQRMMGAVDEIEYTLHHHKVEIDLFHERIKKCEAKVTKQGTDPALALRLAALEEKERALASDLKSLRSQLGSLSQLENKVCKLEKQINGEVKQLKQSMQKMVALLQEDEGNGLYTVKFGDSLGQIALDHKTSIKKIKELNRLDTDQIFMGQQLKLP